MDPAALSLFIIMPASRKVFPPIVYIRVKYLLLRQQLAFLVHGHFPVILAKTQCQLFCPVFTEPLLLRKASRIPGFRYKDRIARAVRLTFRNQLQPKCRLSQKADLYFC